MEKIPPQLFDETARNKVPEVNGISGKIGNYRNNSIDRRKHRTHWTKSTLLKRKRTENGNNESLTLVNYLEQTVGGVKLGGCGKYTMRQRLLYSCHLSFMRRDFNGSKPLCAWGLTYLFFGALSLLAIFLSYTHTMQRRFLSSTTAAANYYKITLKRSTIGLSKDYKAAAHTLGLYRLQQTTYQPVNASTAGSILKLKELVQVENVAAIPTKEELLATKPSRGYKVIGSKI